MPKSDISRRKFIALWVTVVAAFTGLNFSSIVNWLRPLSRVRLKLAGPDKQVAHLLRENLSANTGALALEKAEKNFANSKIKWRPAGKIHKLETVIIGAGIAGLSAGWYLLKNNYSNFKIFELEERSGGNSSHGEDPSSKKKFPVGAHYLPLPSENAIWVKELLVEMGVLKDGHYDEEIIVQDPKERLFIYERWQDGLFPKTGARKKDLEELERFHSLVKKLSETKGRDGRKIFTIPVQFCSRDPKYLALDQLSMLDYLRQNQFSSRRLYWYIEYGCRDDYGANLSSTSAWAALHYFASRQNNEQVLVWPSGNGYLAEYLNQKNSRQMELNTCCLAIERQSENWRIFFLDKKENQSKIIEAKNIIYCAPKFTAPFVFQGELRQKFLPWRNLPYSPWLVTNLSLTSQPDSMHGGIYWDNVIYQSNSLGYVNNEHSFAGNFNTGRLLTHYLPFSNDDILASRRNLYAMSQEQMAELALTDLKLAHPDIESHLGSMEFHTWAHAMIRPVPGLISKFQTTNWHLEKENLYFAHSDQSGISIFEEAQFQGITAARRLLKGVVR